MPSSYSYSIARQLAYADDISQGALLPAFTTGAVYPCGEDVSRDEFHADFCCCGFSGTA